jgi:hypothetical protein
MSNGLYVLLFLVGSSALAAWASVRFDRLAPRDFRRGILHTVAATVACQVILPAFSSVMTAGGDPELRVLFLVCVALPVLTYVVLSFIWLIALIQATIRRGMHS